MRKDITVAATPRQERGKNENRRLRVKGSIPAVVYGTDKESVAVTVNPKEVNKILHSAAGHNTIFNIGVEGGETSPVMVVDWQHHPTKGNLMHVDLRRIDLSQRLTVKVPVHTHGDPKGVKQQGGLYEIITRDVEVNCLPDDIPEAFNVDVSGMVLGQNLRASELPLSGSMVLLSSPDQVISHVIAARGSATEEAAEGAAKAEPEVVKKGKKEAEK